VEDVRGLRSVACFEGFQLDLRSGELCRDGGPVIRLPEQPCQILTALLQHPGQVVSREELRKRLWPNDTIVEFEHSISAAINRLRQALGDSAENPRYIETLARRGYRWMVPVDWRESRPLRALAPVDSQSLLGQSVSHYHILEKLGDGGMGVVYKARDTHLDRFVAIKVLPPEKVADPERKRRFILEAKSASALNHPNIVTIYDIASDKGIDFIAMEHVPGRTLDHLIPRRGLPLGDALKYAVQIADALAAAHSAGIIHRDLKPNNVMVSGAGEQRRIGLIKVLDFGLAKLVERAENLDRELTVSTGNEEVLSTQEGMLLGTAAYMSPEQAEGKKVDVRSDIFSFGALLYEMVSGRKAFPGDSKMSTLSAILREEPKPVSQLIEGLPMSWNALSPAACVRARNEGSKTWQM
jgi:eukaryotic-like serine/threonine-protein kinase